jgi:glucosamine--fructose-6-phosphate aminotransferase (isomerizing)
MGLRDEIHQQPDIIRSLLSRQAARIVEISAELLKFEIDYVFLTARGTSDNAGLYAKYLLGTHNQLPIALAAPSIFSVYKKPPKLTHAFVLGISQSGMSPDIVSVLENGKSSGVPTMAITNAPDSPLAKAAEYVIDVCAGEEQAIAATKSYTAQLVTIAMLSAALAKDQDRLQELQLLPECIEKTLELEPVIKKAVERYYYMQHCVVLGRGYNYATAFEWALKMKELTYIIAEPYSSADFLHGPIAIVDAGFPVMVVIPKGAVYGEILSVVKKLRQQHKALLLLISNDDEALQWADIPLRIPEEVPEWLSPIVSIVPAQLFCYHLAHLRGIDPEVPRGLTKITETQ